MLMAKTWNQLIADVLPDVQEIFPWELEKKPGNDMLLVDIREPAEYQAMHIKGSINAPRGILEQCSEWEYEETIPALARAKDQKIVLLCRSGNRSILAAHTLQRMGFKQVYSLKTGLRGWNDFERPLVDQYGQEVDIETADNYFTTRVRDDQRHPLKIHKYNT